MAIKSLSGLKKLRTQARKRLFPDRARITVGLSTCGVAAGGLKVLAALKKAAAKEKLKAIIEPVGCMGLCYEEPLVDVYLPGLPRVTFAKMTPRGAAALVKKLKKGDLPAKRALCRMDSIDNPLAARPQKLAKKAVTGDLQKVPGFRELPFTKTQVHNVMRNCGLINPDDIGHYVARDGYFALHKALIEMTPVKVIDTVEDAGLRGRGGGGFSTGFKWRACSNAEGEPKYVLCNADEGNPGAYMDRTLLEADPHLIIEGMLIGAYGIGATEGFIYVRHEYPRAIERLDHALAEAREMGFLGENILGTDFSFDIKISQGCGAFVCGESTALMASIEGKVGEPRHKYIHTSDIGLWERPSTLNNVETWANVALIIEKGSEWYRSIGSENNAGTKVYSLGGRIARAGLVEVPLGISMRELIFDIGGGIPDGKAFKAVSTGGPSGGSIPEELLDTPVDFDGLKGVGAEMGAGGMIVMDETDCMVDVTRYILDFLEDESCGKCVPCREGVRRMHHILSEICAGRGKPKDLKLLEEMAGPMMEGALCGLGKASPHPVLTAIRYFKDEFDEHIKRKKCRAKVCAGLK